MIFIMMVSADGTSLFMNDDHRMMDFDGSIGGTWDCLGLRSGSPGLLDI